MKLKIFTLLLAIGMGFSSVLASEEEPISSQPEGTLKTMSTYSYSSYYDSFWEILEGEYQDGVATQFVYAADGETVYLKNPIPIFHSTRGLRVNSSTDSSSSTLHRLSV